MNHFLGYKIYLNDDRIILYNLSYWDKTLGFDNLESIFPPTQLNFRDNLKIVNCNVSCLRDKTTTLFLQINDNTYVNHSIPVVYGLLPLFELLGGMGMFYIRCFPFPVLFVTTDGWMKHCLSAKKSYYTRVYREVYQGNLFEEPTEYYFIKCKWQCLYIIGLCISVFLQ